MSKLVSAREVDEAAAAGRGRVEVPQGSIVTPAAKDRARELGITIEGGDGVAASAGANGNSASSAGAWRRPAANGATTTPVPPGAPSAAAAAPRPAAPPQPAPEAQKRHEIDIKPNYFESSAIDNVYTISLELGAAIWVVKDRLRVIEELLDRAGVVKTESIEQYRADPDIQKNLVEQRNAFIQKIYGIIAENPG